MKSSNDRSPPSVKCLSLFFPPLFLSLSLSLTYSLSRTLSLSLSLSYRLARATELHELTISNRGSPSPSMFIFASKKFSPTWSARLLLFVMVLATTKQIGLGWVITYLAVLHLTLCCWYEMVLASHLPMVRYLRRRLHLLPLLLLLE